MADTKASSRLLLIGSAASEAMSPALWNPVLAGLGTGWTYEPWDVAPGADMAPVRRRLLEPDVVAANVTMPHKQWAAAAADSATEAVRLGGACNLLVRRGARLFGHNTDIDAACALLGVRRQRHALLLGAGGAARAALIALRGKVDKATIADRDEAASAGLLALAGRLGIPAQVVAWQEAQRLAGGASLIVNATPIGKSSLDGPVWGGQPLASDAVVYDFVYGGHVTSTIARARELGAACIDGWDHLREQAVAMVSILGLGREVPALLRDTLASLQAAG